MMPSVIAMGTGAAAKIDVTIVMPCLNEAKWLAACIANAKEVLTRIRAELGLNGEIVVARQRQRGREPIDRKGPRRDARRGLATTL